MLRIREGGAGVEVISGGFGDCRENAGNEEIGKAAYLDENRY